jgi:EAL domain-containing protein (putative c-di-GMP-specific phosphodiesterase class I)
MPIDFIKIDRSFTMNVGKDVKTLAIVDSIIYLAKKLNIRIIAEGIETEAERQCMRDLGCEYGQGYLFSKPLEFSQFLAVI